MQRDAEVISMKASLARGHSRCINKWTLQQDVAQSDIAWMGNNIARLWRGNVAFTEPHIVPLQPRFNSGGLRQMSGSSTKLE